MKRILPLLLLLIAQPLWAAQDLLALYELAVNNDPTLQAAKASRDSAKLAEPLARANLLPNVSLSANATLVDQDTRSGPSGSSSDSYEKRDATLALSQPLYRRDRWIALDQSKVTVEKADVDYLAAEQSLLLRLSQAYFGVLSAQDTLVFARAEKKAIARQLDQAKQRFDVGLIAITAVHEAQAAFDQARASEIAAENGLDNALESLREIVGDNVGELAVLRDDLPLQKPEPADIASWTRIAGQRNPTLLAARQSAEIARQQIALKRAGHQPTVDLVGSYALTRSNATSGSDIDTGSIGLQLAMPLYSGGSVVTGTQQAQLDFQAAQHAVEQSQRSVTRQVRDGYRGVLSNISRVQALEATRTSSQSALEATEAGFEVGTRTIVDVLNGQRDLYRAMRDYAQSRYDYILNGLSLKQAAGILSREDLAQVNGWLK